MSEGRWTQFDEDSHRLPTGLVRTSYDACSGRYFFLDTNDGQRYFSNPHEQFGQLFPASQLKSLQRSKSLGGRIGPPAYDRPVIFAADDDDPTVEQHHHQRPLRRNNSAPRQTASSSNKKDEQPLSRSLSSPSPFPHADSDEEMNDAYRTTTTRPRPLSPSSLSPTPMLSASPSSSDNSHYSRTSSPISPSSSNNHNHNYLYPSQRPTPSPAPGMLNNSSMTKANNNIPIKKEIKFAQVSPGPYPLHSPPPDGGAHIPPLPSILHNPNDVLPELVTDKILGIDSDDEDEEDAGECARVSGGVPAEAVRVDEVETSPTKTKSSSSLKPQSQSSSQWQSNNPFLDVHAVTASGSRWRPVSPSSTSASPANSNSKLSPPDPIRRSESDRTYSDASWDESILPSPNKNPNRNNSQSQSQSQRQNHTTGLSLDTQQRRQQQQLRSTTGTNVNATFADILPSHLISSAPPPGSDPKRSGGGGGGHTSSRSVNTLSLGRHHDSYEDFMRTGHGHGHGTEQGKKKTMKDMGKKALSLGKTLSSMKKKDKQHGHVNREDSLSPLSTGTDSYVHI